MNDKSAKPVGKVITLSYDSDMQKWIRWDDFERRIAHHCRHDSKKPQKLVKVNGNNKLLDRLGSIKNNQAFMMWMLQKIAAKIGVKSEWTVIRSMHLEIGSR